MTLLGGAAQQAASEMVNYGDALQTILEESEEGFSASGPGCHSQGTTEREALDNITEAI